MVTTIPNLNALARDDDRVPIQIGSSFQTADGTGTPITSPLTLTGSVQTLTVPVGAVEVILYPLADSLQVSEIVGMTQSDVIAAGSKESYPCARMATVYVKGTNTDTLNFRFTIV